MSGCHPFWKAPAPITHPEGRAAAGSQAGPVIRKGRGSVPTVLHRTGPGSPLGPSESQGLQHRSQPTWNPRSCSLRPRPPRGGAGSALVGVRSEVRIVMVSVSPSFFPPEQSVPFSSWVGAPCKPCLREPRVSVLSSMRWAWPVFWFHYSGGLTESPLWESEAR